jgi:hypothetical protein
MVGQFTRKEWPLFVTSIVKTDKERGNTGKSIFHDSIPAV